MKIKSGDDRGIDDPIKTHLLPSCNTYYALNIHIDCIQILFMLANRQKYRQPANVINQLTNQTTLAVLCVARADFLYVVEQLMKIHRITSKE